MVYWCTPYDYSVLHCTAGEVETQEGWPAVSPQNPSLYVIVYVGTFMTCRGQLLRSSLTLQLPRDRSGVVSTSACNQCTVTNHECVWVACSMHTQAYYETPLCCPGFFFHLHTLISICILQKHIACCIVQKHLETIPFQFLMSRW